MKTLILVADAIFAIIMLVGLYYAETGQLNKIHLDKKD